MKRDNNRFRHAAIFLSSATALAVGSWQALAADPVAPPATTQRQPAAPEPHRLTLHPAPADQASSKIRLLPDLIDQSAGNAAPLYMIAAEVAPMVVAGKRPSADSATQAELVKRVNDLFDLPPNEFPVAEARALVDKFSDRIAEVDVAAHRTDAQWEPNFRRGGFAVNLPYLDQMRKLSILMALKARVEIGEGKWDDARRSIADSMAMARHLNTNISGMIQPLVSNGLAELALNQSVTDWITRPGSPNLYWALTALPSTTVSLRDVAQSESSSLELTDPQFRQALHGELPSDGWPAVVKKLATLDSLFQDKDQPADANALADKLVQATLPRAREFLLGHGTSRREVDEMSAERAVGTYLFAEYKYVWEEMWKGWTLPTQQALDQIDRSWCEMKSAFPRLGDNPLVIVTLFGSEDVHSRLGRVRKQLASADERISIFRTIEAIRDYASRHNGQPPASLDQITDLPIPLEPLTNKPFAYELKGKTMTLRGAKPYDQIWYELAIGE